MNGRFEEKLARIAFGDATPEEIAQIERKAQTDPAAAKALAEFRQMKAELRQLADTPAHQLSNERLREAILAQGLHPKPMRDPQPGLGAGWIWMPVAAAILGVALVKLRHAPTDAEPRLVLNSSVQTEKMPPLMLPNVSISPKFNSVVAKNDVPKQPMAPPEMLTARSTVDGTSRSGGRRHRRSNSKPGEMFPSWVSPNEDTSERFVMTNIGDPSGASTNPSDPAAASAKTANGSPIVLIDSDPDARTGAPGATEVGTANNVVIGG